MISRIFKIILFSLLAVVLIGCSMKKDFSYGANKINEINIRHNTTLTTYPKSTIEINLMLKDFEGIRNLKLNSGQEPFGYLLDYRILDLEAEKNYVFALSYGSLGTTDDGFGCKHRPFIIDSVWFRNQSALKGFEAVDALRKLINKYPEEAKTVGLSEKNALFINATFYGIYKEAKRDSSVINYFCPENETVVLYRKELESSTNLSKEYINNLTYEQAANMWKDLRGMG